MRRTAAILICICVASLAACSDPEPSSVPTPEGSVGSTTDTSEATQTSAPDDSAQTTSPSGAGEDPGVPEIPAEAMEDTEDGAEAFVEYYIELLNYTGRFPKAEIIDVYADARCDSCDNYEDDIDDLASQNHYYDQDTVFTSEIQALRFGDGYRVAVVGSSPEYYLLDGGGDKIGRAEEVPKLNLAYKVYKDDLDKFKIEWIKDVVN